MNSVHKAYRVLGLEPGTAFESVKRRYKRLVMVWHPDRMQNDAGRREAEEELKRINHGYDILKNHFESQHKAGAACACQPPAGSGAHQQKSTGSGTQSGSGAGGEGKTNPEEEARRRHEERRRKAEAQQAATEAARKAEEQRQAANASKRTAEEVLRQAQALKEEKLRWHIAMVAGVALVLMLAFGFLGVAAKNVITDIQRQWDTNHPQSTGTTDSQPPPSVTTSRAPATADDPDNPYIPQEYRFPGGNPKSWRSFMAEEERKQRQREEEQHQQGIYFTRLAIDRNQRIIGHCTTTIAQLEAKIADPYVSDFENNKLRDFRDFQQRNLENAQRELATAMDKLKQLEGNCTLSNTPPPSESPFGPPMDPT